MIDIRGWLAENMLKLNMDKMEVIFFAPRNLHRIWMNACLEVGCSNVTPSPVVRNLGVFMNMSSISAI